MIGVCAPRVRRVPIPGADASPQPPAFPERGTTSMATPSRQASSRPPSYAARIEQIAHLELPESEAERLWHQISRHRRELLRRLGRDVGPRVALLDFLLN